ncbi:MAG: tetratricopeptide repeat protein, partial [Gammaproteobacteria bacterium]
MIYRFDDCELDTTTFELRCGGATRDVQPQVLELLRYLIENRERLVTKDELFENVWAGRIVSESALSSRIKAARQAIGDDGDAQRLIRTVHGRGFRFIGAIDDEARAAPGIGSGYVSNLETAVQPGAAETADSLGRPSVAVLPFANMSDDPEQEYFSDGITDDIITALSKYRWLMVTARNSTFVYKHRPATVREIAAELGVRYVLQGTVRRSGEHLRVTCQLVDAHTGTNIWTERFDSPLDDVFAVQDEIASAIVGAVGPEIDSAEQDKAKRLPPGNLDAWEIYQRGMWHFWRYTRDEAETARGLFKQAINMDPDLVGARAALAMVLVLYVLNSWSDDPPEALLDEAIGSAKAALAIDERDTFAHYAMGRALTQRGQHDAAIGAFSRALELNPNFAMAHFGLGTALVWSGKHERALPHLDRSMKLSPNDPVRWAFEVNKG